MLPRLSRGFGFFWANIFQVHFQGIGYRSHGFCPCPTLSTLYTLPRKQ
jgi:hypothetical protein